MLIYQITPAGFLGSVVEVENTDIIPMGFTRTAPEEEINEGDNFVWQNNQWIKVDYAPPIEEERPSWTEIRGKRNFLLSESDWTQLSDSVCDKEAWALYRAELRNITEAFEKSTEVVFPKKPTDL